MRALRWTSLALVVAASCVVLAACGGSSGGGSTGGGETGSSSSDGGGESASLDGVTLSYVGFGNPLDEQIQEAWMKPFEEETGATFTLESPTEYSKIQTQVETGNVTNDLVDGDAFFINPECGKLFEEIDVSQAAVLPQYRVTSKCGVADYVYGIGMYYEKSAFPNGGPENCDDFFDTAKFPGKRVIWSYVAAAGALECAAIAEGANPKDPYPIDLDKAFSKLESIKSDLTTFDTGSQAVDGMVNEDAPIYLATFRNYVQAINQGANIGLAQEFAGQGNGAFAIPKGAPHAEAAEQWLKYVMEKENNRRFNEYAPPFLSVTGGEAGSSWPPQAKEVDIINGPLAPIAWVVDQNWWAENYEAVSKRYAELLAG